MTRLWKNIGWTVSSRIGAQGVAVLSNIMLARYFGSAGFGEYAFISSVLLIGNAFSTFGTDMILIRKLASDQVSFTLADGLLLQLLLSLLYVACVLMTGLFISTPFSLNIYIFALFPLAFFTTFNIDLRARQEMKTFSFLQFAVVFMQLLAVFALWIFHADMIFFAALMLIVHIVSALLGSVFYGSRITSWRFSFSNTLALLKESTHMALIGTLRLVYEKIAVAILPGLTGLSMTGIFSASTRIMEAGKLGHLSAFTALYPEMARNTEFGRQMKGLRLLLGMALLIAIFIFIFAEIIIRLLFGDEFAASVLPLRIMAWVIVPYVLVTYTSLGLVALGFEKPVSFSLLVSLSVLLILIVSLTPLLGLNGVAAAILFSEIIHAALLRHQWRVYVISKLP